MYVQLLIYKYAVNEQLMKIYKLKYIANKFEFNFQKINPCELNYIYM